MNDEGKKPDASLKPSRWYDSLETYLRGLVVNTGAMADLRSGLNMDPAECLRMHRWVSRFVPENLINTDREQAVYGIASLVAMYPNASSCDRDLGYSIRQALGSKNLSEDGMEKRLIKLARSSTSSDLVKNLRPIISLLRSAKAPISWSLLAKDISWWSIYRSDISRRWMRSFFAVTAKTKELEKVDQVNSKEER